MRVLSRRLEARVARAEGRLSFRALTSRAPALWAGIALVAGLVLPGQTAGARAPGAAAAAGDLYVDNEAGAGCSDSGSGTETQPFCTIAAAAAVVQPGQTVIVAPGNYSSATISRSGTPSAPVTFLAVSTGAVRIGVTQLIQNAFVVSGAHDVVISGFNTSADQPFLIDNSSDITINGGSASGFGAATAAIGVTGASSNVTISRVTISARRGSDVQIDQGVTGAVVTSNTILGPGDSAPGPSILVTSAPRATVTSNTLDTLCHIAVMVTGTSPGASLENNIVETAGAGPTARSACANPADATGLSVSGASTLQTVAD